MGYATNRPLEETEYKGVVFSLLANRERDMFWITARDAAAPAEQNASAALGNIDLSGKRCKAAKKSLARFKERPEASPPYYTILDSEFEPSGERGADDKGNYWYYIVHATDVSAAHSPEQREQTLRRSFRDTIAGMQSKDQKIAEMRERNARSATRASIRARRGGNMTQPESTDCKQR